MGQVDALSKKLNAEVLPADATNVEDLEMVFTKSVEILGGKIDFVLHSIGMSPNVRKKRTYDDLDYDMFSKTLDISAVSFHKMLQVAKKQDRRPSLGGKPRQGLKPLLKRPIHTAHQDVVGGIDQEVDLHERRQLPSSQKAP